jgi:excisionase family DNA binding protein
MRPDSYSFPSATPGLTAPQGAGLAAYSLPQSHSTEAVLSPAAEQRLLALIERTVAEYLRAQKPELPEEYLTKEGVARLLKITPRTVDNYLSRGLLPYIRIGRVIRIRVKDLEAHLVSRLNRL